MTTQEYNQAVDQFSDSVYRFALRCCSSRERCKDAVQEAFATLWEHRRKIAFSQSKAYLLSTVHNHLMSEWRHSKVEEKNLPELQGALSENPNPSFDLRELLQKALETLPPVQRECLQLRDVEGYSYNEIAAILHLSLSQVQVYIFRARVAMKKLLKPYMSE